MPKANVNTTENIADPAEETVVETANGAATESASGEETVKIRLPLTPEQTEDVYVSVNDRSWLIKRGEWVELPACAVKQLEHRDRMILESIAYEQSLQA